MYGFFCEFCILNWLYFLILGLLGASYLESTRDIFFAYQPNMRPRNVSKGTCWISRGVAPMSGWLRRFTVLTIQGHIYLWFRHLYTNIFLFYSFFFLNSTTIVGIWVMRSICISIKIFRVDPNMSNFHSKGPWKFKMWHLWELKDACGGYSQYLSNGSIEPNDMQSIFKGLWVYKYTKMVSNHLIPYSVDGVR